MFHPNNNKKNVTAKFGTVYEMAVRRSSQWTWISNVHILKKGNIT